MGLVDILQNYYSDPKEQRFILEGIETTAMELDLVIRDIVQKSEQFKLTKG
jgi:hypothetical protein